MTSVSDPRLSWTDLLSNRSGGDEFADSRARRIPYVLVAAILALAHLGSSWLGHHLISEDAQFTPVWPEAGLDLVAILVFGTRYWPVLFSAYFADSLWTHAPWLSALGVALAGIIRTLTAVWLFRWISAVKKLGHWVDLVAITAASAGAPLMAAIFGTLCLIAGGRFPSTQWPVVFGRWWIADALGILTVTPVLIMAARSAGASRPFCSLSSGLKTLLYMSLAVAACYLVFFRTDAPYLLFAAFVLILIAAAWLGPAAARLSALIIAAVAIWATHLGVGTFTGSTARENLQNLGLFLVAISLTGVAVGAFRAIGNLALPGVVLLAGWSLSGLLYASLEN